MTSLQGWSRIVSGTRVLLAIYLALGIQAQAATVLLDPTDITLAGSGSVTVKNKTFNWESGLCNSCSPTTDVFLINPNKNIGEGVVEAITGDDILLGYKSEFGGAEEGSYASFYSTTYSPATDPDSAIISWDGGYFFSDARWLEVKDGAADPATYLFDISGWDGMMDISLQNFWPGDGGAISHVAIWSVTALSEPSSLMLLGMGLLFVGGNARRRLQG